jgi:serine/threonine-protein kinase
MEPAAAADLVAGAGDALGAAHAQGIVHRDVKPANLLVTDDRRVKITDFGIARAADAVALTRTGEVLGTPQYLSPEQAEGKSATPASDVYSLGAVAFECLAGRRPFVAETAVATALAHLRDPVPDLPETVPPALAAVVHRALAKDPAERHADGSTFAAAVRDASARPMPSPVDPATTRVMSAPVAAASGAGAAAGAAATEPVWRRWARAVPVPVWAAAGAFVVVLAIAALAATTTGGTPGPASQHTPRTPASHATAGTTPPTGSSPSVTTSASTGPPPKHPKPGPPGQARGHEHGKGHE